MSTMPRPSGAVFTNEPTGPITRFRVVGTPVEIDLRTLPDPDRFTIGRTPKPGELMRADIQLDDTHVSLVHGELERRGEHLWYTDKQSKNGTYVRNDRESTFVVKRGLMFRVAEPTLLALDELLVRLRHEIARCIGLDDHQGVDYAVARVVDDRPVLLIGPAGSDQERLARAIHDASGRRSYPFLSISSPLGKLAEDRFDAAKWGTVFVDLYRVGKVTQTFARRLLGADKPLLHLRPVIAGPALDKCEAVLGQLAQAQAITLPPLDRRRQDALRLIREWFEAAGRPSAPLLARLQPARLAHLTARSWPGNLVQLREAAERLAAFLTHDRLEDAAASLRPAITRQALAAYLRRLFGED